MPPCSRNSFANVTACGSKSVPRGVHYEGFTTVECKARQRKRLEKLVRPDQIYFGNYDDLNSNDEQAILESEVAFGGCPPSWLTKASRLRWMQLDSVGFGEYVHLDWPDLSKQITCTNLVGFFATPVAETVLAGILFFLPWNRSSD